MHATSEPVRLIDIVQRLHREDLDSARFDVAAEPVPVRARAEVGGYRGMCGEASDGERDARTRKDAICPGDLGLDPGLRNDGFARGCRFLGAPLRDLDAQRQRTRCHRRWSVLVLRCGDVVGRWPRRRGADADGRGLGPHRARDRQQARCQEHAHA